MSADIPGLIAEARDSSEWARKEGATGYSSLFIRLADALEAVTAENESLRRRFDWLKRNRGVEAERDEALSVIAEVRALHYEHQNTIHTIPATVCAHRYCVDGMGDQVAWPCPTGTALSRIPEHPKED